MAHFYETTVLVDPPEPAPAVPFWRRNRKRPPYAWGIQVLASPAVVDGVRIDYDPLFQGLTESSSIEPRQFDVADRSQLIAALSVVADPEWDTRVDPDGRYFDFVPLEVGREAVLGVGAFLYREAWVAAETSPLTPQSLMRLVGEGGTITFLIVSHQPVIVVVGGAVGFLAIRGLGAVGGALWRGAVPNVERLGDRASAKIIDALSKRLNLYTSDTPPPAEAQPDPEELEPPDEAVA